MGTINGNRLLYVFGYQEVTTPLGSAIAARANGNPVMVSYNLYEFVTVGDTRPPRGAHPGRIPADVTAAIGKESQTGRKEDANGEQKVSIEHPQTVLLTKNRR